MIRVLVVLPFYGGSLPIGRYCIQALQDIGCQVDLFDAPSFYSAYDAIGNLRVSTEKLEYLENSFLQVVSHAICAKAETFQPDLILCMAQAPVSRQALKRLRSNGFTTAMWFVEDYRLFGYWRAYAPYYDIFAIIQKEPFVRELAKINVHNSLYLPLAALPSIHKPLELSDAEKKEYGAEISFLGAGYPNRCKAFLQLARPGFKIWGNEWDEAPALLPYIQRGGARISSEDAVKVYNATNVNLNLHSSAQAKELVPEGDFVNPRTFELASAGVFQLVDKRSLMDELFAEDELAKFSTIEELREKVQYFLAHPEEREKIVAKGQKRVVAEHQYSHRMQKLLDYCAAVIPQFGIRKEPEVFSLLSEGTKKELVAFLQQEGLPNEAAFSDVVTAVRAKSGSLTELETALLFLDEWKQQYFGKKQQW